MSHSLRTGPDRQRSAATAFGTGDPTFAVFAGTLGTPAVDDRSPSGSVPMPDPTLVGGPDLMRLRRELVAGTVRGIVVDHAGGRECMGEMGCVARLSDLLDDPCLTAEPIYIANEYPLTDGGEGGCFDGGDTLVEIVLPSRRRTAFNACIP